MPTHRITDAGAAARVAANVAGEAFILSHMVLGSGQYQDNDAINRVTDLAGFEARIPITDTRTGRESNQLVIEAVVPIDVGGFDLTEVGLETSEGILYAYSTVPRKRLEANSDGTSRLTLEFVLEETNSDDVTVVIDESAVYATRNYIDDAIDNLSKTIIRNNVSFPVSTLNNLRLSFEGDFEPQSRYQHFITLTMDLTLSKIANHNYVVSLSTSGPVTLKDERNYAVNSITDNATSLNKRWTAQANCITQGKPSDLFATIGIVRYLTTASVVSQTVPVTIKVESFKL